MWDLCLGGFDLAGEANNPIIGFNFPACHTDPAASK
jgi:hypothetical protein